MDATFFNASGWIPRAMVQSLTKHQRSQIFQMALKHELLFINV